MTNRGFIVFALLLLGAAALLGRLAELQIYLHDDLVAYARENAEDLLRNAGPRGEIVDRSSRILAISIPTNLLIAQPSAISHKGLLAIERAAGTPQRLTRRAKRSNWIEVTKTCDPVCSQKLEDLVEDGTVPKGAVHLEPTFERRYPHGSLAAHIVGFINAEGVGHGIEGRYNDLLRAPEYELLLLKDAKSKIIETRQIRGETDPAESLMLTVDLTIQQTLETALEQALREHGALSAHGVVLDPNSGEVLALASLPSFDPNRFGSGHRYHCNGAISTSFEPGSVIKPLSAAAILDSGTVDPAEPVYCEKGSWRGKGFRAPIRDHHAYGWLPLGRTLIVSSNIGISKFSGQIAPKLHYETLRAFGIGERTGIDLPGEQAGKILRLEAWKGRDRYAVSYGYIMEATPLQIAIAYAAIANGGRRIQPFLARATGSFDKGWRRIERSAKSRQVTTRETTERIASWLHQVVIDEDGTGSRAAVNGYRVAGKTGTAEKVIDGRYDPLRNVSTFAGFAPVEDPRAVIVISINEPSARRRGAGITAAPAFATVMAETLRLMHVQPNALRRDMASSQMSASKGAGG